MMEDKNEDITRRVERLEEDRNGQYVPTDLDEQRRGFVIQTLLRFSVGLTQNTAVVSSHEVIE